MIGSVLLKGGRIFFGAHQHFFRTLIIWMQWVGAKEAGRGSVLTQMR